MADSKHQTGGEVLERTKQQVKKPEMFKVLLINDDYTTMDFVMEVLETIFQKQPAEAYRIMMAVHTQGKGLCGLYPHEIAETKVTTVIERARSNPGTRPRNVVLPTELIVRRSTAAPRRKRWRRT